jgi:hypothetical protein
MTAAVMEVRHPGPVHPARPQGGNRLAAAGIWPGLLLTSAIAGAAFALRQVPGVATFSPMILAIIIGIAFHNLIGTPARGQGRSGLFAAQSVAFRHYSPRPAIDGRTGAGSRCHGHWHHSPDARWHVRLHHFAAFVFIAGFSLILVKMTT